MVVEKRSTDIYVALPEGVTGKQVASVVERAAAAVGPYISHVGGYSRTKYPNAVHWHFKRDRQERGLIDATYWDVKSLLWLMVRHREPRWVHETAPLLRRVSATLASSFAPT